MMLLGNVTSLSRLNWQYQLLHAWLWFVGPKDNLQQDTLYKDAWGSQVDTEGGILSGQVIFVN